MDFDFSFAIKGKLGQLIERAVNNAAERKEELRAARHDNDLYRECLEKTKLINQLRAEAKMSKVAKVEADKALNNWIKSIHATANGSVVAAALADYYKGWDNIPSCYFGLSVQATIHLFINTEWDEDEADDVIKIFNGLKFDKIDD